MTDTLIPVEVETRETLKGLLRKNSIGLPKDQTYDEFIREMIKCWKEYGGKKK